MDDIVISMECVREVQRGKQARLRFGASEAAVERRGIGERRERWATTKRPIWSHLHNVLESLRAVLHFNLQHSAEASRRLVPLAVKRAHVRQYRIYATSAARPLFCAREQCQISIHATSRRNELISRSVAPNGMNIGWWQVPRGFDDRQSLIYLARVRR